MTLQEFADFLHLSISHVFAIPIRIFEYSFTFGDMFKYFFFLGVGLFVLMTFIHYGISTGLTGSFSGSHFKYPAPNYDSSRLFKPSNTIYAGSGDHKQLKG